MIRIWGPKSYTEQLHRLRTIIGSVKRAMASGGTGENPDRSEVNKGVDGLAKPSDPAGDKVLVQQFNPVTGKQEWAWTRPDYDYHQEIARSSYADMLHDTERNEKYYSAISKAIQMLRERGQRVQVLDIGTGTGLLSMMAAAEGADSITACEAFEPMANCAEAVMEENGYRDFINLVHKRSNEVTVGEGQDMEQRANLLVTEVFDTELIGEGAISTYTHAHQHLLQEDCLTVPRAANMYVQPVCSDYIRQWNSLRPGGSIRVPEACERCGGASSLHDLQLDQISPTLFSPVSPPVKVFRFDFSKRGALKKTDSHEVDIESQVDGQVDAVFVWWDLEMDPQGEIILSCAPRWAHPLGDKLPWRDHWMQAIFYPSRCLQVKQGETFRLISHHDEYSLCFETASPAQQVNIPKTPSCVCGLHGILSRSRIGMLNDDSRNRFFQEVLKKRVNSETVCVYLGDFSMLPIMAAQLGASKVLVFNGDVWGTRQLNDIIKENQLSDKIVVSEKSVLDAEEQDFLGLKVDLVIAEPYFRSSVLPWDSLYFWYAVSTLRPYLAPQAQVLPATITVYAMAMRFKDLWKIRAPVGLCQGFMLNIFDTLIKNASKLVDQPEEPQPLWEYPGIAMSHPVSVFSLDVSQLDPSSLDNSHLSSQLHCQVEEEVNGVALWCDYDFGEGQVTSTGPVCAPVMGEVVEWNVYCRQAVYLSSSPCAVMPGDTLDFTVQFQPKEGSLKFDWSF